MNTTQKLFQFLKEFNKLKTRPRLDVNSFEKVLWLSNIPNEKECYSITHNSNFENVKFDKWIEIKKPRRKPSPKPPREIIPWLKDDTLNECTIQPQLHSYIIVELSDQSTPSEEESNEKVSLEDCPEIKDSFKKYLNQEWFPWSKEEKCP